MSEIKKILAMLRHHLYNSVTDPKVWAAELLILTAIFRIVYPYVRIVRDLNGTVSFSAAALPFMANNSILLIFCALLLIFSEMPFKDQRQIFLLTRSGRRSWYISQLLYIIAVSLSAAIFVILTTWLFLSGHISFANAWTPIESTVSQSVGLRMEYQFPGYFSYDTISSFSPRQVFFWCVPVGTLAYVFFGALIFALNLITRKTGGIIFGAAAVGYHVLTWILWHPRAKWLAVLDWSNISIIDMQRNTLDPPPEFALSVLAGGFVTASVIAAVSARKRSDIL